MTVMRGRSSGTGLGLGTLRLMVMTGLRSLRGETDACSESSRAAIGRAGPKSLPAASAPGSMSRCPFSSASLTARRRRPAAGREGRAAVAASGSPSMGVGRPIRTCLSRIGPASSRVPGSWQAPPVSTSRRPATLSKPASSRRERTSSKVSSSRGLDDRRPASNAALVRVGHAVARRSAAPRSLRGRRTATARSCRNSVLMRSAWPTGVDSPRAMSLVTCWPPTGRMSVNTSSPSKKTATEVVPPPMSISVTPSCISSSTRQPRADGIGRDHLAGHLQMAAADAGVEVAQGAGRAVTTLQVDAEAVAEHAARVADAAAAVDRIADRDGVDDVVIAGDLIGEAGRDRGCGGGRRRRSRGRRRRSRRRNSRDAALAGGDVDDDLADLVPAIRSAASTAARMLASAASRSTSVAVADAVAIRGGRCRRPATPCGPTERAMRQRTLVVPTSSARDQPVAGLRLGRRLRFLHLSSARLRLFRVAVTRRCRSPASRRPWRSLGCDDQPVGKRRSMLDDVARQQAVIALVVGEPRQAAAASASGRLTSTPSVEVQVPAPAADADGGLDPRAARSGSVASMASSVAACAAARRRRRATSRSRGIVAEPRRSSMARRRSISASLPCCCHSANGCALVQPDDQGVGQTALDSGAARPRAAARAAACAPLRIERRGSARRKPVPERREQRRGAASRCGRRRGSRRRQAGASAGGAKPSAAKSTRRPLRAAGRQPPTARQPRRRGEHRAARPQQPPARPGGRRRLRRGRAAGRRPGAARRVRRLRRRTPRSPPSSATSAAKRDAGIGGLLGHQRGRRHAGLGVDLEQIEPPARRRVVVAEIGAGDAAAAERPVRLERHAPALRS